MTHHGQKRMVVKVGSRVLCDQQGDLDIRALASLSNQVAALWSQGWEVLLISSGAVAAGSGLEDAGHKRISNPVTRKQVLAATGQVRLMATYQREFRALGMDVAQILATKSDFQSRHHYLNMRACIEALLAAGVVPVVNENDVVSVTELMFTDNDELAGLMAGLVNAGCLALLTTVPGVLAGEGEVIGQWDEAQHSLDELVQAGTSHFGRGGMHSKISVARKTAALGTAVVIADGREPDILEGIANGSASGTLFPPTGSATPAKRWLASMGGHALGVVIVNEGAEQALCDRSRLASLLPVGIDALEGEFMRGDVIEVHNHDGRVLGYGRAQYDHSEAREILGQQGQKPIIHYDYLYLVD